MDKRSCLLNGVDPIGWGRSAAQCFPGALASAMRYLGERVSDDFVMGVSGGAFVTLWGLPWSPANPDMLVAGDETIYRAFDALGYGFRSIGRWINAGQGQWGNIFRQVIVDSIDRGKPVLGKGIIGPPEVCLVTGYEQDGETLLGWSYYQIVKDLYTGPSDHPFRKSNWAENCFGLILIGEKYPVRPGFLDVLRSTLQWAVRLWRVPDILGFSEGRPVWIRSGRAAFEATIEALGRVENFPAGDLDTLTFRCVVLSNDGLPLSEVKRHAAAGFLREMLVLDPPGSGDILKASEWYDREVKVLKYATEILPLSYAPPEERLRLAESDFRQEVAGLAKEALACEDQALTCLESALMEM